MPKQRRATVILRCLSLLCALSADRSLAASDLYLSQNARTFELHQSSLVAKGLAHACLTTPRIPDSIPCNPALLTRAGEPRVGAQAMLSNGYDTLDRVRRLLEGKLSDQMINELFSRERVIQIEGNGEVHFVSRHFAARYTPLTAKAFSVVRNEANPDVELSGVMEKGVSVQGAYAVNRAVSVGVTGRSFSRQFIHRRFQLIELATEAGKNSIKPRKQRGNMFDVASHIALPGRWKPRAALMVANIGQISGDDSLEEPVDVQGGLGMTVPMGWAEIDFGLDYRGLTYEESWDERLHLGSNLRFGAMNLFAGVDYYGLSGGVFYGLQQVNAGILFTTTQAPWNSNDYYANTVYLQVGWQN